MRPSTVVATAGWSLTLGAGIGALALRILRPDPIPSNTFGMGEAGMVAFVVLGITWGTVGAILVARRPANVVGPWVLIVGLAYAASIFFAALTSIALAQGPGGHETARTLGWLTGLATLVGGGVFYLALIFPTGRGHTARWHRVAQLALLGTISSSVSLLLQPGPLHLFPGLDNPFGLGPDLRPLFSGRVTPIMLLGSAVFVPLLFLGLASRYRAAGHVERLQLRWFLSSIVLTGVALAVVAIAGLGGSAALGEWPLVTFALTGTAVPVAIGIAVLRHHLYDLDRLISRTIGWALVSSALIVVFALAVVGLQAALAGITQGQTLAVAASTLIAFALFQPLRRRVQRAVDRRFDRTRYDAEQIVGTFGGWLRDQVDLGALDREVGRVAGETVRPRSVGLWLRNLPNHHETSIS